MEAGVVLDLAGLPLYWHIPDDRTSGSLPESPELWDIFWTNRTTISGFAHSHPGSGVPGPSYTDVTTFAAIEAGLGRRLDWWIISEDSQALFRWTGPDRLRYLSYNYREPIWLSELRKFSYPQM
jgi:hypothetical protein